VYFSSPAVVPHLASPSSLSLPIPLCLSHSYLPLSLILGTVLLLEFVIFHLRERLEPALAHVL
jgi:hypothetical protein